MVLGDEGGAPGEIEQVSSRTELCSTRVAVAVSARSPPCGCGHPSHSVITVARRHCGIGDDLAARLWLDLSYVASAACRA
jgi:hypothetical protein